MNAVMVNGAGNIGVRAAAVRKEKVYFLQVVCHSLHLSPNGIA